MERYVIVSTEDQHCQDTFRHCETGIGYMTCYHVPSCHRVSGFGFGRWVRPAQDDTAEEMTRNG